jgi:hypothetical protein
MPAEFDQAHGFLEPEALDALADVFFGDESLGGLDVDLRLLRFLAVDRCQLRRHQRLSQGDSPIRNVAPIKTYSYITKTAKAGRKRAVISRKRGESIQYMWR